MKYVIMLCTLVPFTLSAMERSEAQTQRHAFSDGVMIKASALFAARSEPTQRESSRYLRPRYLECDADGNVVTDIDVSSIGWRTTKESHMFHVRLNILAINEKLKQIKLSCTIFKEEDPTLSSTITSFFPLDLESEGSENLIITDEPGRPVVLSIKLWPSFKEMPNAFDQEEQES